MKERIEKKKERTKKKKKKKKKVVGIDACINRPLFLSFLTNPLSEGLRIEA